MVTDIKNIDTLLVVQLVSINFYEFQQVSASFILRVLCKTPLPGWRAYVPMQFLFCISDIFGVFGFNPEDAPAKFQKPPPPKWVRGRGFGNFRTRFIGFKQEHT